MDITFDNITTHLGLKRLGYFFYIVDPAEHMPKTIEGVRRYFNEVSLWILVIALLETLLDFLSKKPANVQAMVSNIGHIALLQLVKIPLKGSAVWVYNWVYTNYRVIDLPCDSTAVWLLGFFAADLNYYWVHRLTHEVHIFWTVHEVHHSSEHLVFSTTLRNHVLYFVTFWVIFNPFAFFLPTPINLVHYELGLIYQMWIHTEKIGKCPRIFEYIFNTPSHHRVHHARNRKYIDKNYGAVLIIWDRIFGTYEDEDPNEKPVYGITKQLKSLNPLVTQTKPFYALWKKVSSQDGLKNKLSAIFKGPGWSPGKPWTGELEDIPHPPPHLEKYYPDIPYWVQVYVFVHFIANVIMFGDLALFSWSLSEEFIKMLFLFVLYTIFAIGFLQDNSPFAVPLEIFRLIFFYAIVGYMKTDVPHLQSTKTVVTFLMRTLFYSSTLLWIFVLMNNTLRKKSNRMNWSTPPSRLWISTPNSNYAKVRKE